METESHQHWAAGWKSISHPRAQTQLVDAVCTMCVQMVRLHHYLGQLRRARELEDEVQCVVVAAALRHHCCVHCVCASRKEIIKTEHVFCIGNCVNVRDVATYKP